MERFVFFAVLILSYASAGVALFTAAVHATMLKRNFAKHAFYVMARIGYATTVGIIAYAVTPAGRVEIQGRTWAYLAGLLLAGIGYVGIAFWDIKMKVDSEPVPVSLAGQLNEILRRLNEGEDRLDAEESRNTDIEEFATESRTRSDASDVRQDVSEKRADEAQQHAEAHGDSRLDEHEKPGKGFH
jgi:hypothetical protein